MRETIVTNYEIEEKDYKLLKTWVPEDPCAKCGNNYACCGCSKKRERNEIIEPLKQAGVFEVQQKVQEVKELQNKLKNIERKIEADKSFIASKGFDLDRIFGSNKQENSSTPNDLNDLSVF